MANEERVTCIDEVLDIPGKGRVRVIKFNISKIIEDDCIKKLDEEFKDYLQAAEGNSEPDNYCINLR